MPARGPGRPWGSQQVVLGLISDGADLRAVPPYPLSVATALSGVNLSAAVNARIAP